MAISELDVKRAESDGPYRVLLIRTSMLHAYVKLKLCLRRNLSTENI